MEGESDHVVRIIGGRFWRIYHDGTRKMISRKASLSSFNASVASRESRATEEDEEQEVG